MPWRGTIDHDAWRIYYADGEVVHGAGETDWRNAPSEGVQVIVRFPRLHGPRWVVDGHPIVDRDMWTGEPQYDPFRWGVKFGSLITNADYDRIWRQACADPRP